MSTIRLRDAGRANPWNKLADPPPCRHCGRPTVGVPRVLEHIERGKIIWAEHDDCRRQTPKRDWLAPRPDWLLP